MFIGGHWQREEPVMSQSRHFTMYSSENSSGWKVEGVNEKKREPEKEENHRNRGRHRLGKLRDLEHSWDNSVTVTFSCVKISICLFLM